MFAVVCSTWKVGFDLKQVVSHHNKGRPGTATRAALTLDPGARIKEVMTPLTDDVHHRIIPGPPFPAVPWIVTSPPARTASGSTIVATPIKGSGGARARTRTSSFPLRTYHRRKRNFPRTSSALSLSVCLPSFLSLPPLCSRETPHLLRVRADDAHVLSACTTSVPRRVWYALQLILTEGMKKKRCEMCFPFDPRPSNPRSSNPRSSSFHSFATFPFIFTLS